MSVDSVCTSEKARNLQLQEVIVSTERVSLVHLGRHRTTKEQHRIELWRQEAAELLEDV